ncbi:MAG: hypothetical protein CME58_02120 [Halieaceae bacterium]|nr:hypothetical protein [Halieaceae bacterium]|tara:strand:+ start:1326 stop:2180 length:855 start_codon:yes stop_codon:yes gene_type:complete
MPPQLHSQQRDIVMRLQGEGGAELLHGQTTADFRELRAGESRYAAFCDPKGRILADVRAVMISPDDILVRGRTQVLERLADHLKPFLMFARTTMTPTDWHVSARKSGDGAAVATLGFEGTTLSTVVIPSEGGYEEHWTSPQSAAQPEVGSDLAEWELQNARARVEVDTIGTYLPQDLNFDLNGTVSFTKGCYTGQEIIARLHYRGTPKRRLHRAQSTADVTPGQTLRDGERQAVGSVVNVSHCAEHHDLLIELKPDAAKTAVFIEDTDTSITHISLCHERENPS